jgi:hypothetical protein
LEKRDTDTQIRTDEDYKDFFKIKTISTALFALGNRLVQIQVNFTKIPTIAANVGGVLKYSWSFFDLFYIYIDPIQFILTSLTDFQQVRLRRNRNSKQRYII